MTDSSYVIDVNAENFSDVVMSGSHQRAVLLYFWAEWCEPCKELGPILAKLAESYRGGLVVARVDCDKEQQLAMQVGVQSLPTALLVKDGQPVDQFMGALSEAEVRQFLDRYVEAPPSDPKEEARERLAQGDAAGALPFLRAAHEQQPDDHDVTIDLARALMQTGSLEEAEQLVDGLPGDSQDDARVRGIRARRAFAERAATLPAPADLEARLQDNPNDGDARIALAIHGILAERTQEAMDHLIHAVRHDPQHADPARETLLEVFDLLGPEHPDARRYRQKLFQMLY